MADIDERAERRRDWAPVPDPTLLTTEALHREIASLRELLEAGTGAEATLTGERFTRVYQRFDLVEAQRVEQKADTKSAVDAALVSQKEAVREQTIASDKAIAKSEAGTAKQIEQLHDSFTTAVDALRAAHEDLKDRVGKVLPREVYDTWVTSWLEWRQTVEARLSHQSGEKQGWSSAAGTVVIVITLVISAGVLLFAILHNASTTICKGTGC
jgi:hypothetical protein